MTTTAYHTRAVLFDLDGTLLDTAPDFINVVNMQRDRHNLPALDASKIRANVSNGARALVRLSFDIALDDPSFNGHLNELLDLYCAHIADHTRLFDGMDSVLTTLETHGIPWGIVTNKPSRFTDLLLAKMALDQRCAVTICPDHIQQTKPHPEGLLKALNILGVAPENSVYVGDHVRDIQAGRAAGIPTIAAAYGYINPEESLESWLADHIIHSPLEILARIQL